MAWTSNRLWRLLLAVLLNFSHGCAEKPSVGAIDAADDRPVDQGVGMPDVTPEASTRGRDAIEPEDSSEDASAPTDAGFDVGPPPADAAHPTTRTPIRQLVASNWPCALLETGILRCWGNNTVRLIVPSDPPRPTPQFISNPTTIRGLVDIIEFSSTFYQGCALTRPGSVYCWSNDPALGGVDPRMFMGNPTAPNVAATGVSDAIAIRAGEWGACVIRSDLSLWCWGRNRRGQLGRGFVQTTSYTAVRIEGLSDVGDARLGVLHACAMLGDRSVRCWGDNTEGQLGIGPSYPVELDPRRVELPPVAGITVSRQGQHTCARLVDETLRCWGRNTAGQLGDGTVEQRVRPVEVEGLTGVLSVGAGMAYTCALRRDGTVWCWGENRNGQLGDGSTEGRTRPAVVPGLDHVIELSVGALATCARRDDNSVWCWGQWMQARPDGSPEDVRSPIPIAGIDP